MTKGYGTKSTGDLQKKLREESQWKKVKKYRQPKVGWRHCWVCKEVKNIETDFYHPKDHPTRPCIECYKRWQKEKNMYPKIEKLLNGETIISKEPGNSMTPIIKSRQPVRIKPITWQECEIGDIVYCKVKGNLYTHLVKGKNDKRGLLIGNNHGRINGWTKNVYGKVIDIIKEKQK